MGNIPRDGKVLVVKEDQRDQCTGALGKGRFPKESEVIKETEHQITQGLVAHSENPECPSQHNAEPMKGSE